MVRLGVAMGALANGDADDARQARAALLRALDPRIHQHAVGYHWIDLWTALVCGDMDEADRIWEMFSRLPAQGVPIYATYNHAVVWLLVLRGKATVALERVEKWRQSLDRLESDWKEFNLLAMEACAADGAGDELRLDRALRRMLSLGRQHRYRNLRTWVPQMVARLCAAAWERGVETEYVRWLVRERRIQPPTSDAVAWPRAVEVRTLGGFEIVLDGQPVAFTGKVPKRPLTLLKALIAVGPSGLGSTRACGLLWPDLEGDAAAEALATALHRLRRLLSDPATVQLADGQITLDPHRIWVDAFAFERACASNDVPALERARQLYRGTFLPGDEAEPWSVTARERLRSAFTMLVTRRGQSLESEGRFEDAIACYRSGIAAEPLAETRYQGLMRCYLQRGLRAEGAAVYRQLRQTLSVVLGIAPSHHSETIARQLLGST